MRAHCRQPVPSRWEIAERALQQGVQSQTISSDLHAYNVNGPVYDLATTVSKFLYLGLPLDEALAKVTAAPAQAIHMSEQIGTLSVGAWGDAVLFELQEGAFELRDSHGQVRVPGIDHPDRPRPGWLELLMAPRRLGHAKQYHCGPGEDRGEHGGGETRSTRPAT